MATCFSEYLGGSKHLTPFYKSVCAGLYDFGSLNQRRHQRKSMKQNHPGHQKTLWFIQWWISWDVLCLVCLYIYIFTHIYTNIYIYTHKTIYTINYLLYSTWHRIVAFFSDPTPVLLRLFRQGTWGSLSQYFRASICPWFALEQIIAGKWRYVMNCPSLDSMVKFHNVNVNKPTFICNLHIWICMYSTYISYIHIYI